ncbi:MAG: hypothetical protein RLZZ203_1794 [Cyanobacteriota bacterium]
MRLIFILLIAISTTAEAQQINFEQKAFDYFFDSIFVEKYPGVKSLQFNGATDKEMSEFSLFKNCFKGEDEIRIKLANNAYGKILAEKVINTEVDLVSFKKGKVKSKIKLHVLHANEVNRKFYVMVGLVKSKHYTHAYFFELDKNGDVLRWCQTGMTH